MYIFKTAAALWRYDHSQSVKVHVQGLLLFIALCIQLIEDDCCVFWNIARISFCWIHDEFLICCLKYSQRISMCLTWHVTLSSVTPPQVCLILWAHSVVLLWFSIWAYMTSREDAVLIKCAYTPCVSFPVTVTTGHIRNNSTVPYGLITACDAGDSQGRGCGPKQKYCHWNNNKQNRMKHISDAFVLLIPRTKCLYLLRCHFHYRAVSRHTDGRIRDKDESPVLIIVVLWYVPLLVGPAAVALRPCSCFKCISLHWRGIWNLFQLRTGSNLLQYLTRIINSNHQF